MVFITPRPSTSDTSDNYALLPFLTVYLLQSRPKGQWNLDATEQFLDVCRGKTCQAPVSNFSQRPSFKRAFCRKTVSSGDAPTGSGLRGRCRTNELPWPGRLFASMVPP